MYNQADPTFDLSYVQHRLNKTVVRVPSIAKVGLIGTVQLGPRGVEVTTDWDVPGKEKVAYFDLSDLNLESPPLGNVTFDGDSYFTCRKPVRNDWRQGLRHDNLACLSNRLGVSGIPHPLSFIQQPVYNLYCKLSAAFGMVEDIYKGVAVSRHFSVSDSLEILYKSSSRVGRVNSDNGKVTLNEDSEWLAELFNEEVRDGA